MYKEYIFRWLKALRRLGKCAMGQVVNIHLYKTKTRANLSDAHYPHSILCHLLFNEVVFQERSLARTRSAIRRETTIFFYSSTQLQWLTE